MAVSAAWVAQPAMQCLDGSSGVSAATSSGHVSLLQRFVVNGGATATAPPSLPGSNGIEHALQCDDRALSAPVDQQEVGRQPALAAPQYHPAHIMDWAPTEEYPQHLFWQQQQQQQLDNAIQPSSSDAGRPQGPVPPAPTASSTAEPAATTQGAAQHDDFDLPEVDSGLRRVLEQHLDAALQSPTLAAFTAALNTVYLWVWRRQQARQLITGCCWDTGNTTSRLSCCRSSSSSSSSSISAGSRHSSGHGHRGMPS